MGGKWGRVTGVASDQVLCFFVFFLFFPRLFDSGLTPFGPILQFSVFFHPFGTFFPNYSIPAKSNKNLKITTISSINQAERYCKNNTFFCINNFQP